MRGLHFISGLPRSGSTMLAAILRQNPRVCAGMTSPVSGIFKAIEDATARRAEGSVFVSDDQRDALLKGVFDSYYSHAGDVVFDTSRMWCARTAVLARLFPKSKFIVMVRELQWIADSFERLYRKNGQSPSGIYGWDTSGTVWTRTTALTQSSGVIGYAYDALREAYYSEHKKRLLLIDYETLCKSPANEIGRIYKFIAEPVFEHDFEDVEYEAGEFDARLGAKNLHTVTGRVKWSPRETILPPTLFSRYIADNFWRAPLKVVGRG